MNSSTQFRMGRPLIPSSVQTGLWDNSCLFTSPISRQVRADTSKQAARSWKPSQTSEQEPGAVGVAAASDSLPCLLLTSQPEVKKNRSAIAKKAECLNVNLEGLIRRVGIERVGFVTLTFSDHVTDRSEASARFNSLATHFLRPLELEFITVPERQGNGRFHFHLAAAFPWDIRTGFDFDACKNAAAVKREHYRDGKWDAGKFAEFKRWERIYFESANQRLRGFWRDLRDVSAGYGFGRCETLPVISNAAAISRYLGAYVTTACDARTIADKGMRTVRYSLTERTASIKFSWADGNGRKWRRGLSLLGGILDLDLDGLTAFFGAKFQYEMRRAIFALGEGYENALPFCAKVPEWADMASRMGFLYRLLNAIQTETVFDINLLTNEPDCPF
jgi:hypothetical protein